jgi:hypothetical protein
LSKFEGTVAKDPIIRQPQGQPPGQPPAKVPAVPQPVVIYRSGEVPPQQGGAEGAAQAGRQAGQGGQVGPAQYIYIQTIVPGVAVPGAQAPAVSHHGPALPPMVPGAYGEQVPPIMAGQPFKPPTRQVLVRYGGGVRHRQPGTSVLGAASLLLGIAACVIYWVPLPLRGIGGAVVPMALMGCALGVAGAAVALIFGRSRMGLPVLGVLACVVAAGVAVVGPDQLNTWWARARIAVRGIVAPTTGTSGAGGAASVSNQNAAVLRDILVQLNKLISSTDDKMKQEPSPQSGAEGAAAADAASHAPVDGGTVGVAAAVDSRGGRATLMSALNRLAAARRDASERALELPAIKSAVAAAQQAREHLDELRKTAAPGSQELRDAADAWMNALVDAANQLHQAVEKDSAVRIARVRYQAAYDALRRATTAPVEGPAPSDDQGDAGK